MTRGNRRAPFDDTVAQIQELVADWALRETPAGSILYAVPHRRMPVQRLWRRWLDLRAVGPGADTLDLVPVSSIPLLESGAIDWASLEALPIVEPAVARQCELELSREGRRVVVEIESTIVRVASTVPSALVTREHRRALTLDSDSGDSRRLSEEASTRRRAAISSGGQLVLDEGSARTLVEALERAASAARPVFFVDVLSDGSERRRGYARLLDDARRVAKGLRAAGLRRGDRLLLQVARGDDYWSALWGCVYSGVVPVPVSVAPSYTQPGVSLNQLRSAWLMLGRPAILTDESLLDPIRGLERSLGMTGLTVYTVDAVRRSASDSAPVRYEAAPDEVALLLLTSGSTGTPKAVPLTHANMLAMARGTIQMNGFTSEDVTLNWMPFEHVGAIVFLGVMGVELGCTQVHVSKEFVLRDPVRWLELIGAHRASISWAPNFAFGLIAERSDDVRARALELSSMRFLVNAGEANVAGTICRFLELLAPFGLNARALRPAFGMSETCSGITWSAGFSREQVNPSFVELGRPIPGATLRIVDERGAVVAEGVQGRLQLRGPSVFHGYLDNDEENVKAFTDGWFTTGDLGFVSEERLVITGRQKDDIIIRGFNLFPHEIEEVVESMSEVARSYTAATAVRVPGADGEELAIFFSPAGSPDPDARVALCQRIRGVVAQRTGIAPRFVIPLAREEVPKTSIGKIQRARLRQRLEAGEFALSESDGPRIPAWFFRRVWRRRVLETRWADVRARVRLVLLPEAETSLARLMNAEDTSSAVVVAKRGDAYARLGPRSFVIAMDRAQDHQRLLEAMRDELGLPDEIVNLLGLSTASPVDTREALERALHVEVAPLLALVHALRAVGHESPCALRMVTHGGLPKEDESCVVSRGLLPGLLASIGHELPSLRCQHVDVQRPDAALQRELASAAIDPVVALRDDGRWIPRVRALEFKRPAASPWRVGGRYLVTGGGGGIGRLVCSELVQRFEAKLLVIGRTEAVNLAPDVLPSSALYKALDVCDSGRLNEAVAWAEDRWGAPLDGILHLAGGVEERALIDTSPENIVVGQRARLAGSLALHHIALARPSCLFVHVSSVLGLFGSPAYGAYSAAASFQESFAAWQRATSSVRAICLSFSRWDEIGIGRGQSRDGAWTRGFYSMSAEQGLVSLDAALGAGEPSVVIGVAGHLTATGLQVDAAPRGLLQLSAYVEGEGETPTGSFTDRRGVPITLAVYSAPELPELPSGEVDRARLPRLRGDGRSVRASAPRSESERELARLWAEALGVQAVGVDDSFFELGGSSVLAANLVARVRDAMGVELAMGEVFSAPTVAEMAAFIDRSKNTVTLPGIKAVPRTGAHALSSAQTRLWMLHHIEGEGPAYNEVHEMRLSGQVDIDALAASLRAVCERHEILRTRFVLESFEPVQIVLESAQVRLERVLLDSTSASLSIAQRLSERARAPFDLASPPLLRATLFELDAEAWVLQLVIHHIVTDGWSVAILMREWSACYDALRGGVEPDSSPLPLQYLDFAAWQRDWLADGVAEQQLARWRERLRGAPTLLELPTDFARPPVSSHRGGSVPIKLGDALSRSIRSICDEARVTPFMVLLAGFALVLARSSGQREVLIGAPVANRRRREFEAIVGCFVNTLALRVKVSDDASLRELIAHAREVAIDAFAHQDLPFERLVEEMAPDRGLGHNPLVQVNLDFQDQPLATLELPGADVQAQTPGAPTVRVDVELHMWQEAGAIEGYLSFARDLFTDATAQRLARSFEHVLRELVADPARPARELSTLAPVDHARVVEWGTGPTRPRTDCCIHDLFGDQVARASDAPAIAWDGEIVSYGALAGRVNQCAHHLHALGVGAGVPVAVFLPRSLDLVIAMLAVLEAGAIYVPMDSQYPLARLQELLAIVAPPVIVTSDALEGELPSFCGQVVCIDSEWETIATQPCARLERQASPRDDAYVIFTSGSTGRPKGVAVGHHAFVNTVGALIERFGITPADRVAQFASCAFDASMSDTFMALASGACLTPVPAEVQLDPKALRDFLCEQEISLITLPTSYLRLLERSPLPSLRALISAGEAARDEDLRHYARTARCFNAYGPTEASVCATIFEVTPENTTPWGVPIGTPIANTEVLVLQGERLAPIGAIGEICLGGAGLARGYLHQEELTAARFVSHPWRKDDRIYRTGDLGRWTPEGELLFVGRVDDEVKVRGHRVNAAEVERAIAEHPMVKDCRVIPRSTSDGEIELIAYYTEQPGIGLWPSTAEFLVYDDLLYHAMASHDERNRCYARAFQERLAGATVVEIGPGPEAILARLCVEAGAAKVYCVELLPATYEKARARVEQLGLSDRIELILGDALEVELPDSVDWCISEIVGSIGGSEGAARIIERARKFLRDPSHMLPERAVTHIAAVSLPASAELNFSSTAAHYVQKIFADKGYRFDLRLCVEGLERADLISSDAVFEDLDFTRVNPQTEEHAIELVVTRAGRLHGFLVWLALHMTAEHVFDSLDSQRSWLPMLLPLSREGLEVDVGDRFEGTVERRPSANGLNPDYRVRGRLLRRRGEDVALDLLSPHDLERYRATPFYARLWGPDDTIPARPSLSSRALREALAARLPRYMQPAHLVPIIDFPIAPNGKVDRAALPAPERDAADFYHTPRDETETLLAEIWCDVLGLDRVDVRTSFFDLGGHSLRLVKVQQRLVEQLGSIVSVVEMFQHPTIESLAALLVSRVDQATTGAEDASSTQEEAVVPAKSSEAATRRRLRAEALTHKRKTRRAHRAGTEHP